MKTETHPATQQHESLTPAETKSLKSLEAKITKGMGTFFDVGESLATIRDNKLYRATHKAFESYCQEKWGMGRSYASRLIGAASVVENLLPTGNKPTSEAVVRPMLELKPTQQVKVWEAALQHAANGSPTASEVIAAVRSLHRGGKSYRSAKASRPAKRTRAHPARIQITESTTIGELIRLVHSQGGVDLVFGEWRVTVARVKAAESLAGY